MPQFLWPVWLLLATGLVASPPPVSLEAAPASTPVLHATTDLVVLNVRVFGQGHRPLDGLPREAFTVYEDGRPQDVTFFGSTQEPATIGLVLDASTSMCGVREAIIQASTRLAALSRPDDAWFVVHFNDAVWPRMMRGQYFSSDRDALAQALQLTSCRGRTAFYDGLLAALDRIGNATTMKRALVVLSDGGDNASRSTLEEVRARIRSAEVAVYAIGLIDQDNTDARPDVLKDIAAASGGEAYFPTPDRLVETFERIATELRSSYLLAYEPTGDTHDGRFHRIVVQVKPAEAQVARVRYRQGYMASRTR